MKKYYINGKERTDGGGGCEVCNHGEWMLNSRKKEDYYYEDDYQPRHKEFICGECNTKYKYPREFNNSPLNIINMLCWRDKIRTDYMEESKMMTPEILEMREIYEKTGVVKENKFVNTKVKTLEGEFIVENCLITRKTKLQYKDKIYYDDLSVILNFLTQQSINYGKNIEAQKKIEERTKKLKEQEDNIKKIELVL